MSLPARTTSFIIHATTAFRLEKELKTTAVLVHDGTAIVVDRLLLRMAGTILNAFVNGTPVEAADNALTPMGLPETPFALLVRFGLPVAEQVSESLHASCGEWFLISSNLQRMIAHSTDSFWINSSSGHRHIPDSLLNLWQSN